MIYALYKGEQLLAIGTAKEIAAELNVKVGTVFYYRTPTYKKRTSENAIRLVKLN